MSSPTNKICFFHRLKQPKSTASLRTTKNNITKGKKKTRMENIPTYDALPPVEGMPAGCAWGVFDKPGEPKDVYGTLNHLTPAVVAAAGAEVRDGVSISLK